MIHYEDQEFTAAVWIGGYCTEQTYIIPCPVWTPQPPRAANP